MTQHERELLIDELIGEVKYALSELTTPEIEKIYSRFIITRTADMEILFRQEAI